eukprot:10231760-Alexandrium_andersonii.AAC.1
MFSYDCNPDHSMLPGLSNEPCWVAEVADVCLRPRLEAGARRGHQQESDLIAQSAAEPRRFGLAASSSVKEGFSACAMALARMG